MALSRDAAEESGLGASSIQRLVNVQHNPRSLGIDVANVHSALVVEENDIACALGVDAHVVLVALLECVTRPVTKTAEGAKDGAKDGRKDGRKLGCWL